jgi:hypothetical protein
LHGTGSLWVKLKKDLREFVELLNSHKISHAGSAAGSS